MKKEERAKLEEAKARAKQKADEAASKKAAGRRGEIGEFGYGTGTKMHTFCVALSTKPKSMDEIQKEKWNKKGAVFTRRFRELVKDNKAAKTKDGKMYIIGSAADPSVKAKKKAKK